LAGRRGRAIRPDHFDIDSIGVHVQSLMPLAFASDEADFLATVTIGYESAKDALNRLAFPIVQNHRGGDDAAGLEPGAAIFSQELGEEIKRVCVSEKQCRRAAAQRTCETSQCRLVHVQRIEIAGAVEKSISKAAAPTMVQILGIAPDLGHALAKPPTAPLV